MQFKIPKQFIVPFEVPVGLKNYPPSLQFELARRCQERAKKLLELAETRDFGKNQDLVDNLVSLRDDCSILSKKPKADNEATIFFGVTFSVGFTDLAPSLGLRTKQSILKDKQFMNQKLSFVEVSHRALVQLGLLKSFRIKLTAKNQEKVHPKLPHKFDATLYYNTQVDFSIVRKNLLNKFLDIPFEDNDNGGTLDTCLFEENDNGGTLDTCLYQITGVKKPTSSRVVSLFLS